EISSEAAYPDPTQFDPESDYYDPKATGEKPSWLVVDVRYVADLKRPVTLRQIKEDAQLSEMMVARRGMRLSVQPVEPRHYKRIRQLAL
ncbi:MAG: EVE domain-containing protein, partial [Verrucomicrobia bacterium]|nr:EVE domain-containing protein [Verrucomicrobiota bacterium]